MLTHITKDLDLKLFKPSFVNELSNKDMDKRRVACGQLLDLFPTIPKHGKVFFSNVCTIYGSGQARNIYF